MTAVDLLIEICAVIYVLRSAFRDLIVFDNNYILSTVITASIATRFISSYKTGQMFDEIDMRMIIVQTIIKCFI
jgi:hypothetical protein